MNLGKLIGEVESNLATLLAQRAEWLKRAEFIGKLSIAQHEQHQYFPVYYRTLAWYEKQIADAYEFETMDTCFPVKVENNN